jgi:hypothetical protein
MLAVIKLYFNKANSNMFRVSRQRGASKFFGDHSKITKALGGERKI